MNDAQDGGAALELPGDHGAPRIVKSRQMGGWWRLWVVGSLVWVASVAAFTYTTWPSQPQAPDHPAFHYQLESKQREMLADEGVTTGTGVLMPNGYTLQFKPDVDQDAMAAVAQAYHAITVRAQGEARRSLVLTSLQVAVIPCLVLAALGWGIGWVRRGFANP
jgi:hypothetical protein